MTLNIDKKWFMNRWAEKGLSLRKVAKLIDIDPGALSYTLSGRRQMKVPEISKIATIMGVSREEVLAHIEGNATSSAPSRSEDKRGGAPDTTTARISEHSGFGFMKGLIKIEEGFDITGPFSDEPWDEGYLGTDR